MLRECLNQYYSRQLSVFCIILGILAGLIVGGFLLGRYIYPVESAIEYCAPPASGCPEKLKKCGLQMLKCDASYTLWKAKAEEECQPLLEEDWYNEP